MNAEELQAQGFTVADARRILIEAHDGPPVWIYAIRAGGYGGDIKIGVSRNPRARLATLQTGCPEELHGLAAWRAHPDEEKWVHEAYAHSRLRGEWFMHSLPLYRFLKDTGGRFRWKKR